MRFVIYEPGTGRIRWTGYSDDNNLADQAPDGLAAILGEAKGSTQYVTGSPATITARPANGISGSVSASPRGILFSGMTHGALVEVRGDGEDDFAFDAGSPESDQLFLAVNPGTYLVTITNFPDLDYRREFEVT